MSAPQHNSALVMWHSEQVVQQCRNIHLHDSTHGMDKCTHMLERTLHTFTTATHPILLCVSCAYSPPVNPDKEIDDPEDSKPEDWDEREKCVRRATHSQTALE